MDILQEGIGLTAAEIHEAISDSYLYQLRSELDFDLSTLRKKLKEYEEVGLVRGNKTGNKLYYSLCDTNELNQLIRDRLSEAVEFFSEEAPLGVIGSFISEKCADETDTDGSPLFSHKHHYILDALDSEVMLELLYAIREQRTVEIHAVSRKGRSFVWDIVPLKIFVSTQQGRYYLIGYSLVMNGFDTIRIDHIHNIKIKEQYPRYEEIRNQFLKFRKHLWGVAFNRYNRTQHIEMDVHVEEGEAFIVDRLRREARCGQVLPVDEHTWRYTADVYDTMEMLPWIRTFTGRIVRLASSGGELEERFYCDLGEMNRMYTKAEGGA